MPWRDSFSCSAAWSHCPYSSLNDCDALPAQSPPTSPSTSDLRFVSCDSMDCEPLDNCPATPESDSEVTRISAMLLSPHHEADASPVAECGSIRGDAPPTLPETVRRRRKVVYGLTPRSLPPRAAGASLGQQRETVLGVAERREGCVRVTGTHGVFEPSEVGRADPHPRRIGRVGDALGARGGD